ncbi:MAG: type II toxin-antitoxin system VapB family antitoxin [Hyphomonadaceae bacterium]|nr:type II toxin-antitoxin system VapB family antitoxin [Hyphomonadaceae bacterium]
MSLNIKDPETQKLAEELAELRGVSVAEAVRRALREALQSREEAARAAVRSFEERAQEVAQEMDRALLVADLEAMGARVRARLGNEQLLDHDALLYDPVTGLPK